MATKKNIGYFTQHCGGKVTQRCIDKAKKSDDPKLVRSAALAETMMFGGIKRKATDGLLQIPGANTETAETAENATPGIGQFLFNQATDTPGLGIGGTLKGLGKGLKSGQVGISGATDLLAKGATALINKGSDTASDSLRNDKTERTGAVVGGVVKGAGKGFDLGNKIIPGLGGAIGAGIGGIIGAFKGKKGAETDRLASVGDLRSKQAGQYQNIMAANNQFTARAGGVKLPGGKMMDLPDGGKHYIGKKHESGGIDLKRDNIEVEGGETERPIIARDGNKIDYIFSEHHKVSKAIAKKYGVSVGDSYADIHLKMEKGSIPKQYQELAKDQETDMDKKGKDQYGDRGPEHIKRYGGRRIAQSGLTSVNDAPAGTTYDAADDSSNMPGYMQAGISDKQNDFMLSRGMVYDPVKGGYAKPKGETETKKETKTKTTTSHYDNLLNKNKDNVATAEEVAANPNFDMDKFEKQMSGETTAEEDAAYAEGKEYIANRKEANKDPAVSDWERANPNFMDTKEGRRAFVLQNNKKMVENPLYYAPGAIYGGALAYGTGAASSAARGGYNLLKAPIQKYGMGMINNAKNAWTGLNSAGQTLSNVQRGTSGLKSIMSGTTLTQLPGKVKGIGEGIIKETKGTADANSRLKILANAATLLPGIKQLKTTLNPFGGNSGPTVKDGIKIMKDIKGGYYGNALIRGGLSMVPGDQNDMIDFAKAGVGAAAKNKAFKGVLDYSDQEDIDFGNTKNLASASPAPETSDTKVKSRYGGVKAQSSLPPNLQIGSNMPNIGLNRDINLSLGGGGGMEVMRERERSTENETPPDTSAAAVAKPPFGVFNDAEEGNAFRTWLNETDPEAAKKLDLDPQGSHTNAYIRRAYAQQQILRELHRIKKRLRKYKLKRMQLKQQQKLILVIVIL